MPIPIDRIVFLLFNGLMLGSIYGLMAVGFALIFGVMKVANFAHGSFCTLGGYITYFLISLYQVDPTLSVVVASATLFFFGYLFEMVVVPPLRRSVGVRWRWYMLILTLGFAILVQEVIFFTVGGEVKSVQYFYPGIIQFGAYSFAVNRVAILIIGILLGGFFWLFITRTRTGKAMRAVEQDATAASLMGINVSKVYALAFGLSAMLAAAGASFLTPITQVYPGMGTGLVLRSLLIVTLGGIGSMKGAIYGSFLIGVVESLVSGFVSPYEGLIAGYIIILLILLFRPEGLFGVRGSERGAFA